MALLGIVARLWRTGGLARCWQAGIALGIAKWDRDLLLNALGIDPGHPDAMRNGLQELQRLYSQSAAKDESLPGSTANGATPVRQPMRSPRRLSARIPDSRRSSLISKTGGRVD